MNPKDKLIYLIKEYNKGKYSTNTFCDQFTVIYNIELDYDSLSQEENKAFHELWTITARFSPYEEDLKTNLYYNEQEVREKVKETIKILSINE